MKSSKSKLIFYIGAFGMLLFMIGDWLLDAAGAWLRKALLQGTKASI